MSDDETQLTPFDTPAAAPMLVCDTHGGVMTRMLEHIGDGRTQLGDPVCPYCVELAGAAAKAG